VGSGARDAIESVWGEIVSDAVVYLNGDLVPSADARVSVHDQGLLYGYGVFETMRAYQGRVFRKEDHLARLVRSAKQIGIFVDERLSEFDTALGETLRANGLDEARIRMTVTGGESLEGPTLTSSGKPNVLVTARGVQEIDDGAFERGWKAVIATRSRHSQSIGASNKTTSYLENLVARAEALSGGADEALILNERECLTEGAMTNVFVVQGNRLCTPAPECGLLRGITRQAIIRLAEPLHLLTQDWIPIEEAMKADEIFATNSMIEVMPITSLAGRRIADGTPGEMTRDLSRRYRALVARELGLNPEP